MRKNNGFLVIGMILLNIGIFGYVTYNPLLSYMCLLFSLVFLVREFVELFLIRKPEKEETTITN